MKKNSTTNSTYDIQIDLKEIFGTDALDSYFIMEDLKQRHLTLNTEVEQYAVDDIVKHIMRYNKEDKGKPVEERTPIILYISSPGGDLDSGFELIDVIDNSKTPVYTVNVGYEYSMAFLIGLSGHKRYTFKNAKFLMHDGQGLVVDSGSKIQDTAKFLERAEQRVKEHVLAHTNITSREYGKKQRVEWYMFSEEAKEKGVVDYIIGVDCDMDEII